MNQILTAKAWKPKAAVKLGDVVTYENAYYMNNSGRNSIPTDIVDWIYIGEVDRVAFLAKLDATNLTPENVEQWKEKLEITGGVGDFVPLTGTEENKPITGPVVFQWSDTPQEDGVAINQAGIFMSNGSTEIGMSMQAGVMANKLITNASPYSYAQKGWINENYHNKTTITEYLTYYVPRAGTDAEHPITGTLNTTANVLMQAQYGNAEGVSISKSSGFLTRVGFNFAGVKSDMITLSSAAEVNDKLELSHSGGIQGYKYVEPTTDFHYVQKKFVDDSIEVATAPFGNSIPLTGTEVSKPINGDLEMSSYNKLFCKDNDRVGNLYCSYESMIMSCEDSLYDSSLSATNQKVLFAVYNKTLSKSTKVQLLEDSLKIAFGKNQDEFDYTFDSNGIYSDEYIEPATLNHFVQKKYVDGTEEILDVDSMGIVLNGSVRIEKHNKFGFAKLELSGSIQANDSVLISYPNSLGDSDGVHSFIVSSNVEHIGISTSNQGFLIQNPKDTEFQFYIKTTILLDMVVNQGSD